MMSALTGHRFRQRWEIDLLDTSDRVLRSNIAGFTAGSLERSIHNTIRTHGSLEVRDPTRVAWHQRRLAIRYCYTDQAGGEHEHPLGIYLPTSPGTQYSGPGATAMVDLYDKMALLSRGVPPSTWRVERGTSVVAAVTAVLNRLGETRVAGPDDGGGDLTAEMTWPPEATWLRIVNDILDAGNFFSIWVDPSGVWQLRPYVAPGSRGVEYIHRSGEDAIFSGEFTHDADGWEVPNAVKAVGRSESDDEDVEAPFVVARNDDPDDPFSIPNRGEVWHVEEDVDATGIDTLGRIAARRLLELSSVTSTYELTHDWIPADLNASVRLIVPDHGIDGVTVLQSDSWSWDAGSRRGVSRVRSNLRGVKG